MHGAFVLVEVAPAITQTVMNPSRERQHVIEGRKLIGEDCRLHALHDGLCILASLLLRKMSRRRLPPKARWVKIKQLCPFRAVSLIGKRVKLDKVRERHMVRCIGKRGDGWRSGGDYGSLHEGSAVHWDFTFRAIGKRAVSGAIGFAVDGWRAAKHMRLMTFGRRERKAAIAVLQQMQRPSFGKGFRHAFGSLGL